MATHSTFLRAHTQHRRAAGQSLVIGHQELGERLYLASAIAQTGITLCNLRTPFGSSIRASCDGLLCLWGDETRQYNIFNPLTGRSIILPNDKRLQTSLLGLYFRHSTSEYCLLAASQDETNILVVGSNSWKKISCRLPAFCDLPNTVDLNGCLHWLAWKQKPPIYHEIYTPPPDIIMTFDKESEIYDLLCLPLPEKVLERNGSKYNLVNFNGEFGLWVAYEDGLELWVLEESLVKKYSVKYGEDEAFLFFDLGAGTWLLGVAVSIGDEELLIDFSVHETLHYLIRWNLKSGAYTLLDWKINYRRVVTTFPYIESLLDPNHSF
ncbi:hypothetical protein KSP40_PGU013424 [Platanthera guangdongensis]|uniref:F-box associated beta-propeller type 3 domain-containing protein n=1 Tax=Platanthera guangdongensis TaxID=2320717 RepID=A0ABR2LUD1_9ASPA